jgi:hypothetical protein
MYTDEHPPSPVQGYKGRLMLIFKVERVALNALNLFWLWAGCPHPAIMSHAG